MFCVLCLAIYLRSIPHKLPRYIKVLKGKEKPLPKKFDWRDKEVIAEVRNQETVSPGVFHSWFPEGWLQNTGKVLQGPALPEGSFGALAQGLPVEHTQSHVVFYAKLCYT